MSVLVGKSAPHSRAKAVKGETIIEDFTLEHFKEKITDQGIPCVWENLRNPVPIADRFIRPPLKAKA